MKIAYLLSYDFIYSALRSLIVLIARTNLLLQEFSESKPVWRLMIIYLQRMDFIESE